jgi:acetyl-CoA carboxylase carboxyl transferase subunit beta
VNWITNYVRPKINSMLGRREVPENLWIKCPETGEMVFHNDLEENHYVIPASGYHMKMSAEARLKHVFDGGKYELLPSPKVPQDPLKFRDSKKYTDRLRDNRTKTGLEDSVVAAHGRVGDVEIIACVHDFSFMGGSLGIAAGEAIIQAFEAAIARNCPLVMFPASGGRADAGRHFVVDAVAAYNGCGGNAQGSRPALHRRPDQSDHRRRLRILRDAG